MSSANNHRKRSHRSEMKKRGAFNAESRAAFYRTAPAVPQYNGGILKRLAAMFHRRAPKQTVEREAAE